MRISGKIKALVATLAIAGSAFGAYVGTASASGEDTICFNYYTSNNIYPADPSASMPSPCYTQRVGKPSAATIRGTHSWSTVYWYFIWYDSAGNLLSSPYSATHYSSGLDWGPGVTIPAGVGRYLPVIYNVATSNDSFYPHL